jgi:hypothetical protein
MSMQVQMGPPGSDGAGMIGIGGASPVPENIAPGEAIERRKAVLTIQRTMTLTCVSSSRSCRGSLPAPAADDTEEVIVMKPDMAAMKRFKSLRDLAPDSPAMTLFQDTIALCIDLFKLSMASMLAVFVPQLCPASTNQYISGRDPETIAGDFVGPSLAHFQTRYDGCTNNPADHDCTFEENFICLSNFNKFVLTWNFICLGGECDDDTRVARMKRLCVGICPDVVLSCCVYPPL